jgi:hypothetical protein
VDETIRPADADDVPALAELASRIWSDAFGESVAPEELALELEEKRSAATSTPSCAPTRSSSRSRAAR